MCSSDLVEFENATAWKGGAYLLIYKNNGLAGKRLRDLTNFLEKNIKNAFKAEKYR